MKTEGVQTKGSTDQSLFHPLIGFVLLGYSGDEHETAKLRLFIIRPFSDDRSVMPFCVETSEQELKRFIPHVKDTGIDLTPYIVENL